MNTNQLRMTIIAVGYPADLVDAALARVREGDLAALRTAIREELEKREDREAILREIEKRSDDAKQFESRLAEVSA